MPFRFEVVSEHPRATTAVDLDGDNQDELVNWYRPVGQLWNGVSAVTIRTVEGQTIDQHNYHGRLQTPHLLDVDADGQREIAVPLVRNDSLFLSVVSPQGKKRFSVFLIDGAPRVEPEGVLSWDPRLEAAYAADVTGDGQPELVTVVNTLYARAPRGVLIHSLPDGERLGSVLVGAPPSQLVFEDFDGDGVPELLAATSAVNNGASAGGFDDSQAYLMLFDLDLPPRVAWSRELTDQGILGIVHGDLDGDDTHEILVAGRSSNALVFLEVLEELTWRPYRKRTFPGLGVAIHPLGTIDLDLDSRPEVLVHGRPGEILAYDGHLRLVRRSELPEQLRGFVTLPDMDGDGVGEVAIYRLWGDSTTTILLNPRLQPKAVLPGARVMGSLRRTRSDPPLVLADRDEATVALRLVRNRMYFVHRYGAAAASVAGVMLLVASGFGVRRLRHRARHLKVLQRVDLNGTCGLALLDYRGRVRWTSEAFRRLIAPSDPEGRPQAGVDVDDFLGSLGNAPEPSHRSITRTMTIGGRSVPVRVAADPVGLDLAGGPYWIVRIENLTTSDPDQLRTWSLMAERVAHGLKNPLTSMLLTLQRLQIEYREHAPAVANRLDRYTTRLEERVEELRRLTSNFLKVVNLQAPDLEPVDVGALARDFADRQRRSLPPDIRLSLKLQPQLPTAMLDRDQVVAALDNLLANAMNAMPNGGTITLSTGQARGIQLPDADGAADYVTIEVLDTGAGVPEDVRQRIFEPGFTTGEDGSGLGLAIVKKVVADHGGSVRLESEVGTGSAFTIYLPVVPPTAPGGVGRDPEAKEPATMG